MTVCSTSAHCRFLYFDTTPAVLNPLSDTSAGAFAVGAAAVWLLNEDKTREAALFEGQGGPLRQQGQLIDSHGEQHIVNWCVDAEGSLCTAVSFGRIYLVITLSSSAAVRAHGTTSSAHSAHD